MVMVSCHSRGWVVVRGELGSGDRDLCIVHIPIFVLMAMHLSVSLRLRLLQVDDDGKPPPSVEQERAKVGSFDKFADGADKYDASGARFTLSFGRVEAFFKGLERLVGEPGDVLALSPSGAEEQDIL